MKESRTLEYKAAETNTFLKTVSAFANYEDRNIRFEELSADEQNLTFDVLGSRIVEHLGIENFDYDILKTLNLYSDAEGYSNGAAILSDKSSFPGIDIAKFGDSISIINKRVTLEEMSILESFEKAVEIYRDYYQYEEIMQSLRKTVERIPEAAFREAVANALIHRTWDVNARIRIMMFDDRIEILSPGGLPEGISKEEYLSGRISVPRNPAICNVFYRLGIVEMFGTGVLRIMALYSGSASKPDFDIAENSIKVVLPVIADDLDMTKDERSVYKIVSETQPMSISDITAISDFGKSKVTGILKNLNEKGAVAIEGNGRGTKYRKKL